MNRSKWKDIVKPNDVLKKLKEKYKDTKASKFKGLHAIRISRSALIIPKYMNFTFKVHSGKELKQILVTKEMIGHKFGEFCPTRVRFEFKKKKKKKKKNG